MWLLPGYLDKLRDDFKRKTAFEMGEDMDMKSHQCETTFNGYPGLGTEVDFGNGSGVENSQVIQTLPEQISAETLWQKKSQRLAHQFEL